MSQNPLGQTRTRIESNHAVIAADSHVVAPLFGWQHTPGVVLVSPAMASAAAANATRGPGFAQYLAMPNNDSVSTCAAAGVERCMYVLEGEASLDGKKLRPGSYAFLPADSTYELRGTAGGKLLLFEKQYVPRARVDPPSLLVGHVDDLKAEPFMGDEAARLACLLPDDPGFDMAVNVFTFQSGAALPFVETHVMEHGLWMLAGQGIYRLGESWYPVTQGDSIWMAAYCPQWFVAMGKQAAQYIYYKDVNRSHLPLEK